MTTTARIAGLPYGPLAKDQCYANQVLATFISIKAPDYRNYTLQNNELVPRSTIARWTGMGSTTVSMKDTSALLLAQVAVLSKTLSPSKLDALKDKVADQFRAVCDEQPKKGMASMYDAFEKALYPAVDEEEPVAPAPAKAVTKPVVASTAKAAPAPAAALAEAATKPADAKKAASPKAEAKPAAV